MGLNGLRNTSVAAEAVTLVAFTDIIGDRDQRAVKGTAKSMDGGKSIRGTVTYQGEGPVNMEATLSSGSANTVENQWGNPDSD
jgi:hypothetical protein